MKRQKKIRVRRGVSNLSIRGVRNGRRFRKLRAGDRVPHTGYFRLDKGMRVVPVDQIKREEKRLARGAKSRSKPRS